MAWSGIKLAQAIGSKGHETGLYGLVGVLTAYQDSEGLSLAGEELLEGLTRRFIPVVRVTPEPFAHPLFFLAGARLALSRGQELKALALVTESLSSSLKVGALSMFTWMLTILTDAYLRLSDSTRAAEVIGFMLSSPTAGAWVRRQALSARDHLYTITDLEQDLEQIMRHGSRLTPADLLNRLRVFESALER